MKTSRYVLLFLLSGWLLTACHLSAPSEKVAMGVDTEENPLLQGDSAVYGLACEGCTDSVVYLLPSDGSDPVKYDIIEATHQQMVKGKIKVGDWIAIVPTQRGAHVAREVVNLDELRGIWCYIVMPQMRDWSKMSMRLQNRMMKNMPDSVRQTYIIPREYGFWLKRHWVAQSVGYVQESNSLEEESPVVYPPLGFFTEWRMWNGKFIMVSGKPRWSEEGKMELTDTRRDTCNIDFLGNDSLVLSDRDGSRSYYRKNNINEVNVRARKLAEERAKRALREMQTE